MYEQQILSEVKGLTEDQQREVLDFAALIKRRSSEANRESLIGSLRDADIDVSEEELRELRKEMWRQFPRDLPA